MTPDKLMHAQTQPTLGALLLSGGMDFISAVAG